MMIMCMFFVVTNAHTLTMSDVPSETVGDLVPAEVPQASLIDFGITETRSNQDLTPKQMECWKTVFICE